MQKENTGQHKACRIKKQKQINKQTKRQNPTITNYLGYFKCRKYLCQETGVLARF